MVPNKDYKATLYISTVLAYFGSQLHHVSMKLEVGRSALVSLFEILHGALPIERWGNKFWGDGGIS